MARLRAPTPGHLVGRRRRARGPPAGPGDATCARPGSTTTRRSSSRSSASATWTPSPASTPGSTRTGCGSSSRSSPTTPRLAGAAVARARGRDRARGRCGRRGAGRDRLVRRRRGRARAQRRPARGAVPRRVPRVEAPGRRADRGGDRRAVRRARRRAQRVPVRPRGVDRGAGDHPRARRPVAAGGARVRRRGVALRRPTHGLRAVHGRARDLLHAARAGWRGPPRPHRRGAAARGRRPRTGDHAVGHAVRRPGRPRRRRLARRGQAGRRREHRTRADPDLHAADHRHARGRPRGADRLRGPRRGEPRPAHPDGRDPRAGPGAAPLLDLGPRPARTARARATGSSSSWWGSPSRSTP